MYVSLYVCACKCATVRCMGISMCVAFIFSCYSYCCLLLLQSVALLLWLLFLLLLLTSGARISCSPICVHTQCVGNSYLSTRYFPSTFIMVNNA